MLANKDNGHIITHSNKKIKYPKHFLIKIFTLSFGTFILISIGWVGGFWYAQHLSYDNTLQWELPDTIATSYPDSFFSKKQQINNLSIISEEGSVSAEKNQSVFVGSRNGTKYYPSDCGSVSRIKPENMIYFASESDAQSQGYTRTAQCK